MKAVTRIMFLDDNGEKFFGEGPARLLHGVKDVDSPEDLVELRKR